jgi:hypothetical protein
MGDEKGFYPEIESNWKSNMTSPIINRAIA